MIDSDARDVRVIKGGAAPSSRDDLGPLPPAVPADYLVALEEIQRRVLWLSTLMIHHANNVRPNTDGTKVGGHQASSASMVTILTALYFHVLHRGDRVAVKPHASPVFHAVQYLLGQLPQHYLTELRAYRGIQAYPSRTKDPERVDFSTGSVGLGAVAPAFAAVGHRYAAAHFGEVTSRRFIALVGDAELDEGSIWEAVLEEALNGLGNVLLIVDLNRQSLDRVVPNMKAAQLKQVFASGGWQVLEAKYGRKLQTLFLRPGGDLLRRRIDTMSNEEYQALIRLPEPELRDQIAQLDGERSAELTTLIGEIPTGEMAAVISNLGGHDLEELFSVFAQADAETTRPTVLFAYTIKGWGLPIAGHPLNHSMLLNEQQIAELQATFQIPSGAEWDRIDPTTPAGAICEAAAGRLFAPEPPPQLLDPNALPAELGAKIPPSTSSQEAFGRVLINLADHPAVRSRIVTASPDVSVSTNLAGWINKVGGFAPQPERDYETEQYRLLNWRRGPHGQHIELGISEMNLFMLLGMLGLSAELSGQHLIPIGTVYDPFVCRGLDALIYGLYSGSKFIFAGTPAGITLSPEGGAHQSTVTPSLGMELPHLQAYEPCFAQEVEWIMLDAIRQCCDREHGLSTYLRLSTRPIEQQVLAPAIQRIGREELRRQVLAGGYRLVDWREGGADVSQEHIVHIVAVGTMIPEAVAAAQLLHREGVAATVLNVVSPRRLYESWQMLRREQIAHPGRPTTDPFEWLIPATERRAPIVTVHDAASHTLSWLGALGPAPITTLGVDDFGQSGARNDLYHHFGIDTTAIVAAALATLDP